MCLSRDALLIWLSVVLLSVRVVCLCEVVLPLTVPLPNHLCTTPNPACRRADLLLCLPPSGPGRPTPPLATSPAACCRALGRRAFQPPAATTAHAARASSRRRKQGRTRSCWPLMTMRSWWVCGVSATLRALLPHARRLCCVAALICQSNTVHSTLITTSHCWHPCTTTIKPNPGWHVGTGRLLPGGYQFVDRHPGAGQHYVLHRRP